MYLLLHTVIAVKIYDAWIDFEAEIFNMLIMYESLLLDLCESDCLQHIFWQTYGPESTANSIAQAVQQGKGVGQKVELGRFILLFLIGCLNILDFHNFCFIFVKAL